MSVDACANLVAKGDPDRFAAAMCAQGQPRADLMVLYAFNLEVARAPWVTAEPMIAQMRLQWWHDAVAEIFEGVCVRRHEVVTPLADLVVRHGIAREWLDEMVAARSFDIGRDAPETRAALDAYLAATGGHLMMASGAVFGCRDAALARAGFGFAAGNLLRALGPLGKRGHKPLPLAGLSQQAFLNGEIDTPAAGVIAELAKDALGTIHAARKAGLPRAVTPALLAGWRAHKPLKQAVVAPAALFDWPNAPTLSERFSLWKGYVTSRW